MSLTWNTQEFEDSAAYSPGSSVAAGTGSDPESGPVTKDIKFENCGSTASEAVSGACGLHGYSTRERAEFSESYPDRSQFSIQHSQPTETSGLGAAVSASAGSYGETAPCTETAGAEIPTESGCSAVRDERVYTSHTAAAKKLRTGAQDGPSVASPTYIGVNAGVQGEADCQANSQISKLLVLERVKPTEPAILEMVRAHYSHKVNCQKRERTAKTSKTWWSNAKLIVFSDVERTFVFAWQWPKAEYRADKQSGFNNTLFHRTERCPFRASEIILAAERAVVKEWGENRAYSYIDPEETRETKRRGERIIGFCYLKAGWRFVKLAASGKHLFEKHLVSSPRGVSSAEQGATLVSALEFTSGLIKEESMSVVDRLSKEENAVLDTNIVDGTITLNLKDGTTHAFTISSPVGCGRGEVTVRQLKARLESIVTHYRTPKTVSTTDPFERVEVFLERSDSHGPQPEIIAQD